MNTQQALSKCRYVLFTHLSSWPHKQRITILLCELCLPLPQLPWLRVGTKCATAQGRVWNAMFGSVCHWPTSNLPLTPSPSVTVRNNAMATNPSSYLLPHRRAMAERCDQIWAFYAQISISISWYCILQMALRNDQLSQYHLETDAVREITVSCAGLMLHSHQSWMLENPTSDLIASCFLMLGRWCIKRQCYRVFCKCTAANREGYLPCFRNFFYANVCQTGLK